MRQKTVYAEPRGLNSYRLRISNGSRPDGARDWFERTVHADTPRELAEEKTALLRDYLNRGQRAPSRRMTLAEWFATWNAEVVPGLRPRTRRSYREQFANRILPALGHVPLHKLSSAHVDELLRRMTTRLDGRKGDLSEKTKLRHLAALSSCLQEAVYRRLLAANPVRSSRKPSVETYRVEVYSAAEARRMLQALEGEPIWLRLVVHLAIASGLRRGEMIGLEWRHIDLQEGIIRIEQGALVMPREPQTIDDTKNEASAQPIPIDPEGHFCTLLREWRERQPAPVDGQPHFIFTDDAGAWIHADDVTKGFVDFLKRHGLRRIRLHDLRHTYATLQLDAGTPLATVSELLRHSNQTTTANIYAHGTPTRRHHAAKLITSILENEPAAPKNVPNTVPRKKKPRSTPAQ